MAKQITVDEELYEIIVGTRKELERKGCANPSYSNALRTHLDLPHITGSGKRDTCSTTIRKGSQVPEPSDEDKDK
jgi:hypothetical protein